MLPEKLASAGYVSHHVGKWHLGLYAPEFTPKYRGFNTSYGFLTGGEDHFTQAGDVGSTCGPHRAKVHDIWETNATAPQYQGQYTGYRINDVAMELIESHASVYGADTPMFMYLALHNTHAPIQAEKRFTDLYPHVTDTLERTFYAMVSTVDETVGNVTRALKGTGMWNNSLVVWMTDNGSPIQVAGTNYPLRGGKGSQWEGGVRVPAVVSGGVLPQTRRGATTASMVHIVSAACSVAHLPDATR
jgi:arylsulfatase A-like enzyme